MSHIPGNLSVLLRIVCHPNRRKNDLNPELLQGASWKSGLHNGSNAQRKTAEECGETQQQKSHLGSHSQPCCNADVLWNLDWFTSQINRLSLEIVCMGSLSSAIKNLYYHSRGLLSGLNLINAKRLAQWERMAWGLSSQLCLMAQVALTYHPSYIHATYHVILVASHSDLSFL